MKKTLAFLLTLIMVFSTIAIVPMSVSADTTATPTTPEVVTYSAGYAGKPAGSGTAQDPYKIASADDLLWMAKSLAYGDENTDIAATTGAAGKFVNGVDGELRTHNPFADSYFVQTANIDLGGKVLPSIGLLNSDATETHVLGTFYSLFGGTYDGQGYSISNGYTARLNPNRNDFKAYNIDNSRGGVGLFGVIAGATIKNVNLKNFKVYSDESLKIGCAGLLVGIAVSAFTDPLNHNLIQNCTTDAQCGMTALAATGRSSDQSEKFYRWGGLVGSATMTTIEDCVNNAPITVNHTVAYVGGIVGALVGGVVRNCENNANITVTNADTATKTKNFRAFGGIVGGIPYNANAADYNTLIDGCVNKGNLANDKAAVTSYVAGGILGGARKAGKITITISNCASLGTINMSAAETVGCAEGALVGAFQIYSSDRVNYPQAVDVRLLNNTSIAMAGLDTKKVDAEEKIIEVTSSAGEVVSVNMENDTNTVACNWINLGEKNVTDSTGAEQKDNHQQVVDACLTVSECKVDTAENATAKVAAARKGAIPVAVQSYTEASEKSGAIRLLAIVDNLDAKKIGVEIIKIKDGSVAAAVETTSLYTSVIVAGRTVNAAEGEYYAAIVVDTKELDGEYDIRVFTEDADGNKIYRSAVESIEFKRGELK